MFALYTVFVTAVQISPAYVFADNLDKDIDAYAYSVCLCCGKDNASKRLELLLSRNHFHVTPTRRAFYATQPHNTNNLEILQHNTIIASAHVSVRTTGRTRK